MADQLESGRGGIEDDCVLIANAAGVLSAKLDKAHRSYPDRAFFLPNAYTWIVEFKRRGKRPRAQQSVRLASFSTLGYPVDVIDSVDDFRSIFAERLSESRSWKRRRAALSD